MKEVQYWLGSESSYLQFVDMQTQVNQMRASGIRPTSDSPILFVQDGVAVISIHGSLITSGNEFTSWFGMTGYNQIRDALIEAVDDKDVSSILLDINSPGGQASGIDEIGQLVSKVNAEHKPVAAFSSGQMCSAALWIGASAGSVSATRLAEVGSIGVIATVMNYKEAMEKDGVKAYVFRSEGADKKALGNPLEEFTAEAKAAIQEKIDTLGNEFITHISNARGLPKQAIKALEGQTYLGFEAKEMKLIDAVTTVEEVAANLKSKVGTKKRVSLSATTEVTDVAKKILDEKTVALIASGVSVDVALTEATEATEEQEVETVPEVEQTQTAEPETEAKVTSPANEEMASSFMLQLASQNEKIIELSIANREMKQQLDTLNVTHSQFRSIVADATNRCYIGLGKSSLDLSTASDDVLLSTHQTAAAEFNKVFKVGGVTEVASTERKTTAADDFDYEALKAARIK